MILKNFILSGFEKGKIFGDRKVFFAVNRMGEGEVEDAESEKNEESEKKGDYVFEVLDPFTGEKIEKSFESFKDYIDFELKDKSDILKSAFLVGNKGIKGFYDNFVKKNADEKEKILMNVENLDGDLQSKLLYAIDESDLMGDIDSIKSNFKEKYLDGKKSVLKNLGDEIEKRRNEVAADISELKNLLSQNNIPFLEKYRETIELGEKGFDDLLDLKSNLEKKFDKIEEDFEHFFNEKKDFNLNKEAKKIELKFNKGKKRSDQISLEEAKLQAFEDFIQGFLDKNFVDIYDVGKDLKSDDSILNAGESSLRDNISELKKYAENPKTMYDCKKVCEEIPFHEKYVDNIFMKNSEEDLEGIINKDEFRNFLKETVGLGFDELKKDSEDSNLDENKNNIEKYYDSIGIDSFIDGLDNDFYDNPLFVGKIFDKIVETRDLFYGLLLNNENFKDFIVSEGLLKEGETVKDLTDEGRKKIKDLFDDYVTKYDLDEIEFDKDFSVGGEKIKNMDNEKVSENIIDTESFILDLIEEVRGNSEYIDLSKKENGEVVGEHDLESDFIQPNLNSLSDLKSDSIKNNEEIKRLNYLKESGINKVELDKTETEIKYLKQKNKQVLVDINSLKNKINNFVENIHKAKESKEKSQERVPVTLQSIWDALKTMYENYKDNKQFDIDLKNNLAHAAILEKTGNKDYAGKIQSLRDDAGKKLGEIVSKTAEEMSGKERKGVRDELRRAIDGKVSIYRHAGLLSALADKGDFSIEDRDALESICLISEGDKGLISNPDKLLDLPKSDKRSEIIKIFKKKLHRAEFLNELEKKNESAYEDRGKRGLQDTIDNSEGSDGVKYFDGMLEKYIQLGKTQEVLDKNGYVKVGKGIIGRNKMVEFDDDQINPAQFHEYTSDAILNKRGEVRTGIYRIIRGVSSGLIHPSKLSTPIPKELVDKVPILDQFFKGKISLEKCIEYDKFITKNRSLDYNNIHDKKEIYKRLGIVMKEFSDNDANEVEKSADARLGKFVWKEAAGKIKYNQFETQILGEHRGERGIKDNEDWSGFSNGLFSEFENFGIKKGDKKSGYEIKELGYSDIKNEEYGYLKETMKTFIAYYYSKIKGTYKKHSGQGKIEGKYLNSKPEKMVGDAGGRTLLNISDDIIGGFKDIGGFSGFFSELEKNPTDFFQGKNNNNEIGKFEEEFDNLFNDKKDLIFQKIREMQSDKTIPTWY